MVQCGMWQDGYNSEEEGTVKIRNLYGNARDDFRAFQMINNFGEYEHSHNVSHYWQIMRHIFSVSEFFKAVTGQASTTQSRLKSFQ